MANDIFIACVGVILKPCRASLAALLCNSVENSTNAMSWRFGTSRTSLNPGNWLNNMDNIISLVSSGRLVKNRIWLGGCSAVLVGTPESVFADDFFFFSLKSKMRYEVCIKTNSGLDFYRFSSVSTGFGGLIFFGRSLKVPFILAITSLSDLQ